MRLIQRTLCRAIKQLPAKYISIYFGTDAVVGCKPTCEGACERWTNPEIRERLNEIVICENQDWKVVLTLSDEKSLNVSYCPLTNHYAAFFDNKSSGLFDGLEFSFCRSRVELSHWVNSGISSKKYVSVIYANKALKEWLNYFVMPPMMKV